MVKMPVEIHIVILNYSICQQCIYCYVKLYKNNFLSFFMSVELCNFQPNCKCPQEASIHFLYQIDWTETVNMFSHTHFSPLSFVYCTLRNFFMTYLELRGLSSFRNREVTFHGCWRFPIFFNEFVLTKLRMLRCVFTLEPFPCIAWKEELRQGWVGYLCPAQIQTIVRLYMQNWVLDKPVF